MCSDSYSEFYRLVQQCISTTGVGKLKCETLNELFAALSRSGIKDKKTNTLLRSILRASSHGTKIGYSTLNEVYKYLKNLRKPQNDGWKPLREIFAESNQNNVGHNIIQPTAILQSRNNCEYTYQLRSSQRLSQINPPISTSKYAASERSKYTINSALKATSSCELDPVHETQISGTPKNISKSGFLNYFGLGSNSTQYSSKIDNSTPSFTMSMFNRSATVPFSSDLGRLLAERVKHRVSDKFKLRKLERLERYINKPIVGKIEEIVYPVTYVERNHVCPVEKKSKTEHLPCKSLYVVIEKLDLVQLKKQMLRRARKRRTDRLYRLRKKCRKLNVILKPSDRKIIDKLLKKRMKN